MKRKLIEFFWIFVKIVENRMAKFFGCIQVGEYTRAISKKRGKFHKQLKPGCHYVSWFCGYQIVGRVSMKISYVVVRYECKTIVYMCLLLSPFL